MSRMRFKRQPWKTLSPHKGILPTAVTPSSIDGKIGWYKAEWSQGVGGGEFVYDAGVSRLVDHSGRGHDLTQGTEVNMPLIVQDADGLSAIRFDGSNDNMMSSSTTSGDPIHVFLVATPDPDSPVGGRIFSDAGANNLDLAINGSTLIMRDSVTTIVKPNIVETRNLIECCFDGSESYFSINGGAKTTGNLALSNLAGLEVGSIGGGFYALFDFYEMIVFNRRLTGKQRADMQSYLMNEYGIGDISGIRGLIARYNATGLVKSGGGTPSVSDTVQQIIDLTGNGYDFVQFDADKAPTYQQVGNPAQDVFTFGGTDEEAVADGLSLSGTTHIFIGALIVDDEISPPGGIMGDIANGNMEIDLDYPDLRMKSSSTTITKTLGDQVGVYEFLYDGSNSSVYAEGAAVTGDLTGASASGVVLGTGGVGNNAHFHVYEMLVFDREITGIQLTQIRNYFNTEYGL